MSGLMRAVVIDRPGSVSIAETALPIPGVGEVRVRLTGSGVCGSNLPVFEGRPWFSYPLSPGAPGHEGWGHVDALGEGVEHPAIGTPVAVLSERAFAQFDVTSVDRIVPISSALEASPFPAEAIACAVNVFRRAGIRAGDRVAVVGIGFLGALLVKLASDAGARVVAVTRRQFARERALALDAAAAVPLTDASSTVSAALAANDNSEFDTVIEATGLQLPLDIASRLTRIRGRLVIAGYHQDGMRHIDMQLWNWRGIDVINAHERDPGAYVEGLREAARLALAGALPLDQLVTHVFPIEDAAEAFRCAIERPDGFLKAVVLHASS
jgi:2-desacetyl-2-hydroxyethyl bacteriochlorophyllide A dehydrogenase